MNSRIVQHDFTSTVSMLGVFVAILIIIKLAHIYYNVFIGPLSKFPGPKLPKATRLVWLWHKFNGNTEHWVLDLHTKYGDIVQTAPGQLSFSSGQAWKDINGHTVGTKTQQFQKCPKFFGHKPPGVHDLIWCNDADHTRMRRNLSHAFSDRALRQQEPLLRQYVNELISKLHKHTDTPQDMVRWYNYTTFDIMGDLAFGEPLGCLSMGGYTEWVSLIFQSIKAVNFLTEMKHFPILKPLIQSCMPAGLVEKRKKHYKLAADRVNERIEKKDARPDIWSFILNAKEEQQLTLTEMHANAQLLMLAGTETTATLLSGLTYLLLTNPAKMENVKREVRENFNSPEEIDIDALLKLKYVNACFEEALRCYPPVPAGFPRLVPEGGDQVCGHYLPGGTRVAVHQLSCFRSPENFHRPTEFLPERWLGDAEFANDQKMAFQPFSFGPRNCIGKNLAYLEMRLIFATVLWHFDLSLSDESRNWTEQKTWNLWEKHPLMCSLEPVIREKKPTVV